MLSTAALYLEKKPTRADILSTFAGIRPLVKAGGGKNTAALSRDHTIHIDQSGLLTITGGKWTTYRNMAQDCVNHAATLGDLPERDCVTKTLNIHGYHPHSEKFGAKSVYGSDAPLIDELAASDESLGAVLDDALPYIAAEVVWAVRHEFARTVEDVLSRRTRALFLNAKAAVRMAPKVAELLAKELGRDVAWQSRQVEIFTAVAKGYMVS